MFQEEGREVGERRGLIADCWGVARDLEMLSRWRVDGGKVWAREKISAEEKQRL